MAEVMELTYLHFQFGPNISCCLKIGNILPVITFEQNYVSKRLGFQDFLVMENLNWS